MDISEARVVIAVPHIERTLPGYFVDSLFGMSKAPKGTLLKRCQGKPLDIARTALAKNFLQTAGGAMTHILFLDADMQFPVSLLPRLLRHNLPIVSATYFQRTDMPQPHAYRFHHEDEEGCSWYTSCGKDLFAWMHRHPEVIDQPDNDSFGFDDGLIEVDGIGFGAVLIQREVFEKVPEPWFEIDIETGGGEDFWFCRQAQKAGYKIFVDFNLQCQHEVRGAFVDRMECAEVWRFGEEDEYDWTSTEVLTEVTPRGRMYKGKPNKIGLQEPVLVR